MSTKQGSVPNESSKGSKDLRSEDLATDLMMKFGTRTNLFTDQEPKRRYLWTDAYAVCNFLSFPKEGGPAGRPSRMDMALQLVDQVHETLGQHRKDDSLHRKGWLSGMPRNEGLVHPTTGGLRIGKKLAERCSDEPLDRVKEWDQDGQYLHYLTQWMHALNRVSQELKRQPAAREYLRYAIELAAVSHAKFTVNVNVNVGMPGAEKRMVWKMSCDLTRVLVPSQGAHDPLDALVSYLELQAEWARRCQEAEEEGEEEEEEEGEGQEPAADGYSSEEEELKDAVEQRPADEVPGTLGAARATRTARAERGARGQAPSNPCLVAEIAEAQQMVEASQLESIDALGIGGLLQCTFRLARLISRHHYVQQKRLLARLISECGTSLEAYAQSGELSRPAVARLAFRELGKLGGTCDM